MNREFVRLVYIYDKRYEQMLEYCKWPAKMDRQMNMQLELSVRRDMSGGSPTVYESVRLADHMCATAGAIYKEWLLFCDGSPLADRLENIMDHLRHLIALELDFVNVFHERQIRSRDTYWSTMDWMELEEECNRVLNLGQPDQSFWVKSLFKLMREFIEMDQSLIEMQRITC